MNFPNQSIDVTVDLREPSSQSIKVSIRWKPNLYNESVLLPAWAPGSYIIRDYVQNVHSLQFSQSNKIINSLRNKLNNWKVELDSLEEVSLEYIVQANKLTVRNCYLDPDFASLCLPAAIMLVENYRNVPHVLNILKPANWNVYLPLECDKRYITDSYDQLVDTPVHATDTKSKEFKVNGFTHKILLVGKIPISLPGSLLSDLTSICEAACLLMQTSPPSQSLYLFVILLLEKGYGGLEHDNASVLHYSWRSFSKTNGYRKFMQLIGHEYLHQWNVRRLRPVEYIVYDYSSPVMSDSLWFAEGVTSYYDLGLTLVAGLNDTKTFLKDLSEEFSTLFTTQGRFIHSLADSSREAWVKLYRSTPSDVDTQVSYYKLGAAVAFCLDVRLREKNSSLGCLLRSLWSKNKKYSQGYSRIDIINLIKNIDEETAQELNDWLDKPGELPLQSIAKLIGLAFSPADPDVLDIGLTLEESQGNVRIIRVVPGSSAQKAGLVLGDELISIAGFRLRKSGDLRDLLPPDKNASVIYCRQGRLAEANLEPSREATSKWEFSIDPNSSCDVINLRNKWLEII